MIDKFLTPAQAAEYLGVRPVTLNVWRWKNIGPPAMRHPGTARIYRYRLADLDNYIAECRIEMERKQRAKSQRVKWRSFTEDQWLRIIDAIDKAKVKRPHLKRPDLNQRKFYEELFQTAAQGYWDSMSFDAPAGARNTVATMKTLAENKIVSGTMQIIFDTLADDPGFPFSLVTASFISTVPVRSRFITFLPLYVTTTGSLSPGTARKIVTNRLEAAAPRRKTGPKTGWEVV